MDTETAAPTPGPLREVTDVARTVAWGLAGALALRVLVFQPFTIPSESMEPGLLVGDYVVVTKFDFGWSRHSVPFSPPLPSGRLLAGGPHRGDVIVFKKPGDERREDVIKRVVGLPGDRIQVTRGVVAVNGREVARTALGAGRDPGAQDVEVGAFREVLGDHAFVTLDRGQGREGDDTGVYRVPPGAYFVMGDNRDNSADSRWPRGIGMGFVPAENIVGRARLILLSCKPGASVLKPWTWLDLRGGRFLRAIS